MVLVNEGFIRAQQEIDDLKGQLDAQSRETTKFQHFLQIKEDELSRAVSLANLQPELDATKAENLRLKDELAGVVQRNRLLEEEKIGLSQATLGLLPSWVSSKPPFPNSEENLIRLSLMPPIWPRGTDDSNSRVLSMRIE